MTVTASLLLHIAVIVTLLHPCNNYITIIHALIFVYCCYTKASDKRANLRLIGDTKVRLDQTDASGAAEGCFAADLGFFSASSFCCVAARLICLFFDGFRVLNLDCQMGFVGFRLSSVRGFMSGVEGRSIWG